MKHKATVDLEFTNGDLFEQEVLKAMRAYAKTIAREAFQNEIQECVVDVAKAWTKKLYENRYSEPMTDKLVRAEVQSYIKEQMSHRDMLDVIQGTTSAKVKECQDEAREYVQSEVGKYLTSAFITKAIQDEIEKSVPQAVLDVLLKYLSKQENVSKRGE